MRLRISDDYHITRYIYTSIFVLTCIFSTVDTHLFLYSSLSRSLALSVGALIMTAVAAISTIKYRSISPSGIFIIAWGLYIAVHASLVPAEHYRVFYILSSLAMLWGTTAMLKHGYIPFLHIENGLLSIALLHIIFMAWQATGMAEPLSDFFPISGSNENPNITAIYLTGCLPIIVKRAARDNGRTAYTAMCIATIMALLYLGCRTAYIGIIVMAATYIVTSSRLRVMSRKWSIGWRIAIIVTAICSTAIFSVTAYQGKKASADGRLLVWKLSARMIAERPQGYGYGLFERNYNLRQAEYFATQTGTPTERRNASFVSMAYNDYLEQGIEGGVTGMLFLMAFYVSLIFKALRSGDKEAAAVVTAFTAMSATNFIYSSIQPWLLLLCYGARIMAKEKQLTTLKTGRLVNTGMALSACIMLAHQQETIHSQICLAAFDKSMKAGKAVDTAGLATLAETISTSELYYSTTAKAMMKAKDYSGAIAQLNKALLYTSSPEALVRKALCCLKTEKPEEAEQCLKTVSHMIPQNMKSRILLMQLYDSNGKYADALHMAHEVANMPIKVSTDEALRLKQEANMYINKKEK